MSTTPRKPPDRSRPDGLRKVKLFVHLEPWVAEEIERDRKAKGWTRSRQLRFLIDKGREAVAGKLVPADPLDRRTEEIMAELAVNESTARGLAQREINHGI